MQYKIPIQIENEDTIVLWLSLRQLGIIMGFGGVAYAIFKSLEPQIGTAAMVLAIIVAVIGVGIALVRVSEMTFLPLVLNYFRLSLNGQERIWSMGAWSYHEFEIGYVIQSQAVVQKNGQSKDSFAELTEKESDFADKLKNL